MILLVLVAQAIAWAIFGWMIRGLVDELRELWRDAMKGIG